MTKITPLSDLTSLTNETSAINTINTNSDRIETAIANTLSRDGSTPNMMEAQLDMNGYRIINHPAPVEDTDVATYGVIKDSLEDAETAAATATAQAVIATDQATISTTQAGISTAQAVIATDAAEDAELFAQQVEDAKLIWQGTYDAGTSYSINDAVTHNGSSFICIQAGTGQEPVVGGTSYWDDLATKGIDGLVTDGDYGDISVSGGVWSIDSGVVEGSNLADGDFGDFSVSSGVATLDTGVVGSNELAAEAITGQTAGTISATSNIVYEDGAGNLRTDDVQGIVDVTTNQLFGGLTVTPTGTELLAVSDGTKVTAQSIADLASGGGLTFTYQDFQATTDIGSTTYHSSINLSDGKILQGRYDNTTSKLRILTVTEDGTISAGSETSLESGALLNDKYFTIFVKLTETKVLVQYEVSTTWKIALLTVDTVANTVTIENVYAVATELVSGYSSLRTQSARLSDATAMLVSGTNQVAASSNIVGRIITLATPTTLTIGSTQNIENDASYNGQYCSALIQEPSSNDWLIMGYLTDLAEFNIRRFRESSGTITSSASDSRATSSVFASASQINGMFTIPRKEVGFIYGMVNTGAEIVASDNNVAMPVNTMSIFAPNYDKDVPILGNMLQLINVVSYPSNIANNIPNKNTNTLVEQINEDVYALYSKSVTTLKLLLFNRVTNQVSPITLPIDSTSTTNFTQSYFTKVRDGQFLLTVNQNTTNYIHYQPFTIG